MNHNSNSPWLVTVVSKVRRNGDPVRTLVRMAAGPQEAIALAKRLPSTLRALAVEPVAPKEVRAACFVNAPGCEEKGGGR